MRKLLALLLVVAGLVAVAAAMVLQFGLPAGLLIVGVLSIVAGLLMPDGEPSKTTKHRAED